MADALRVFSPCLRCHRGSEEIVYELGCPSSDSENRRIFPHFHQSPLKSNSSKKNNSHIKVSLAKHPWSQCIYEQVCSSSSIAAAAWHVPSCRTCGTSRGRKASMCSRLKRLSQPETWTHQTCAVGFPEDVRLRCTPITHLSLAPCTEVHRGLRCRRSPRAHPT